MKIENLKQLQQLIAVMRKSGVGSIKVDGIELELGSAPAVAERKPKMAAPSTEPSVFDPGAILVPVSIKDSVEVEQLTEEQMLMWSVTN